ncbi:MAG: DUF697 domain-containing protein [SAR324 cluster bacterium]|nr:DUF697 domain-containing protein [SAR324 cluster bacterium]
MTETQDETDESEEVSREEMDHLIRNHMYGSFGIGLIPFPFVDIAALTILQVKLVKEIADAYEIPFSREKIKNVLFPLVSAVTPSFIAPSLTSLIKVVPIVGQTAGAVTMPVISGAVTYATGQVFVSHFESGGTLLNINVAKMKAHYSDMFEKGKGIALNLKKEKEKEEEEQKETAAKED